MVHDDLLLQQIPTCIFVRADMISRWLLPVEKLPEQLKICRRGSPAKASLRVSLLIPVESVRSKSRTCGNIFKVQAWTGVCNPLGVQFRQFRSCQITSAPASRTSIVRGFSRLKLASREYFQDLQVCRSAISSGLLSWSRRLSQTSRGKSRRSIVRQGWTTRAFQSLPSAIS